MRNLRHLLALMAAALLLVGCGNESESGGDADASGCKETVAEAAEATDLRDEADLQPAFEACKDLAEFGSAVEDTPEALDDVGSDIEGWVQQQCQESETLSGSALCESLG